MKLIGSNTSPFVRKVRIVLAEKKLDHRYELENVWSSDTTIKQFNPLGKVPCLVMEDGGAVFDSRVIVEYLDGLSPNARLIPQSGRARTEVKTWEALADGLCDAAVGALVESRRDEAKRDSASIARQLGKVDSALVALEQGLNDKAFCTGVAFTLADVAAGCALGYLDFRYPQIDWRSRHSNLARLFDKLNQRPSFVDTVLVG